MGFKDQLCLLLWKNFTLRKRQPIRIIIELVWPLLLFLILMWVKLDNSDLRVNRHECHFEEKAMPSAGMWPFMRSLVCSTNNTCYKNLTYNYESKYDHYTNSTLDFIKVEHLSESILELNTLFDNLLKNDFINKFEYYMDMFKNILNEMKKCSFKMNSLFIFNNIKKQAKEQNITIKEETLDLLKDASLNFSKFYDLIVASEVISSPSEIHKFMKSKLCSQDTFGKIDPYGIFTNAEAEKKIMFDLCQLTDKETEVFLQILSQNSNIGLDLLEEMGPCLGDDFNILDLLALQADITTLNNDFENLSRTKELILLIRDNLKTIDTNKTRPTIERVSKFLCGRSDAFNTKGGGDNSYITKVQSRIKSKQEPDDDNEEEANFFSEKLKNITNTTSYVYDNSTSEFCNQIFYTLEYSSNPALRMLWRQLKPIVRGSILYTPNTPIVNKIIQKSNWTFEFFSKFQKIVDQWNLVKPLLYDFAMNGSTPGIARMLINFIYLYNASMIPDAATYLYGDKMNSFFDTADSIAENTLRYIKCFNFDKFRPIESEEKLINTGLVLMDNQLFWAGIVFEEVIEINGKNYLPSFMSFKIRMNSDKIDWTVDFKVKDKFWEPLARSRPNDMKYITSGFAYLQDMIERAAISINSDNEIPGIIVQQFPYPCYIEDRFALAISRTVPMFMVLAWIFSISMMVKSIVYEKEQRLKEFMRISGLSNYVHWVAWFITSFITMFISVILLCIVLKAGGILEYTNALVIFVFITIFSISMICESFFFSVLFNRANLAAACAAIFYFIGYLPYALCVQWEEYMLFWHKCIACLSCTVAFGFGCSYFSRYERMAIGSQWNNIWISPIPEDEFSMGHSMVMMLFDAFIYLLATWYIEAVFPGEFGVPEKWYFIVQKSYWYPEKYAANTVARDPSNSILLENLIINENNEPNPTDRTLGVSIRNLKKIYKKGSRPAVDGLNLNFYEGQITSFLGHNGAGKTTTMSILTGLYAPTNGTAFIYGKDIRYEMKEIRKSLGLCPQHNVLFDNLTVDEHFYFYGRMKNIDMERLFIDTNEMIIDLGLNNKRNSISNNLSGGMKRKLSIAIALIGGSKVVILDEPTAGVDPYARRFIWDILLKYKAGRTIILSTHFMDEADILGDRIAIISDGQLKCCGSSQFLKQKFGDSYTLTFVLSDQHFLTNDVKSDDVKYSRIRKNDIFISTEKLYEEENLATNNSIIIDGTHSEGNHSSKHDTALSDGPSTIYSHSHSLDPKINSRRKDTKSVSSVSSIHMSEGHPIGLVDHLLLDNEQFKGIKNQLLSIINKHVKDAIFLRGTVSELSFRLPDDNASLANFEDLFIELDLRLADFGITCYGVMHTSLEEVFLKVASKQELDEEDDPLLDPNLEQKSIGSVLSSKLVKIKNSFFKSPIDDPLDDTVDVPLLDLKEDEKDSWKNSNDVPRIDSGLRLYNMQFKALIIKRYHYMRRSKRAFIAQIVLPAIFICIAMTFSLINPPVPDQPSMEIHPWLMTSKLADDKNLKVFHACDNNSTWANIYERQLYLKPQIGNRCMNPRVHIIKNFPCVEELNSNFLKINRESLIRNPSQNCSCKTGFQTCPQNALPEDPGYVLLSTTDKLYNLTGYDISDYLLRTTYTNLHKRYGGITFRPEKQVTNNITDINKLMKNMNTFAHNLSQSLSIRNIFENITVTAAEINFVITKLFNLRNIKVWFDNTGYVSMVAYVNAMNNLLFRYEITHSTDGGSNSEHPEDYGIVISNHPMNKTKKQLARFTIRANTVDALISISIIFAMSQIPASFVVFLIEERQSGSKHLQFVSGVNIYIFWMTNLFWDMCNYFVSSTICIILFILFQQHEYISPANAPCLVALLFLYGWAITPMMYSLSFFFKVPSTAFVLLGCVNIFLGLLSTLSTFILELFMEERLDEINYILKRVFLILPHFCLGRGLIDMTRNQLTSDVFSTFGEDVFENPLNWDMVGKNLFSLSILGFVFIFITLTLEAQCTCGCSSICAVKNSSGESDGVGQDEEDVDVAAERKRISQGNTSQDVLIIHNLTKIYHQTFSQKSHLAVDQLTFGVKRGECFGLLGVNGAGKTSLFRMLTGDLKVTEGHAKLDGYSILTDMNKVHQLMGYCPQFDALISLLSVEEHLYFYSRLRGIPEPYVPQVVKCAIKKLGLTKYSTRCTHYLSGGNKRKLSAALALVGNPIVIYLDEPTTGMDPKSRRFLWDCINSVVSEGNSVVLTSHSMEECEALCNRLVIMVNGKFVCMGSIRHLKNRFGTGYTVVIRMQGEYPFLTPIEMYIKNSFPSSELKERHPNMLYFQFNDTTIANIFGRLEDAKRRFNIVDYSVSQTTLDQVFINFAKKQSNVLNEHNSDEEIVNARAGNFTSHTTQIL